MQARMVGQIVGPGLLGKNAKQNYMKLRVGQNVRLVREPDNEVDYYAVQVHTIKGGPVGYLRRQRASVIARYMDEGITFHCSVVRLYPTRTIEIIPRLP